MFNFFSSLPFATHFALERSGIIVAHLMVSQGCGFPECLVTHFARVGSDPRVYGLVLRQGVLEGEAHIADLTLVWFDTRVDLGVTDQGAPVHK